MAGRRRTQMGSRRNGPVVSFSTRDYNVLYNNGRSDDFQEAQARRCHITRTNPSWVSERAERLYLW